MYCSQQWMNQPELIASTPAGKMFPSIHPRSSAASAKRKRLSVLPVIRVIQIDTPTLVQTDVANFRSTVQNLTGNMTKESTASNENAVLENDQGACSKRLKTSLKDSSKEDSSQASWPELFHISSSTVDQEADSDTKSNELVDVFSPCSSMEHFSEGDIMAGLISGEPLPDVPLLPPLIDETSSGTISSMQEFNVEAATDAGIDNDADAFCFLVPLIPMQLSKSW